MYKRQILCFDKAIDKTTHKNLIPNLDGLSKKIVKGWPVVLVLFLVLLGPAMYGNSNYEIYYDIAGALPQSLDSAVANKKLEEKMCIRDRLRRMRLQIVVLLR